MSNTYYNVQLGNPKDKEQFWYPLTLKSNVVDLTTFVGATTAAAGVNGLVPAPAQKASSEDPDKFLCNDGSWKVVSGGGGGGSSTTYKTTLNNTLYGDSDGVSLGSWYAPSSGTTGTAGATAAGQLLLSVGSTSAPAWTSFTLPSTGTNKLLSYTGGTGWSLVDMVTNTDEKVKQSNMASSTTYPLLVSAETNPTSGTAYESRFSTKLLATQSSLTVYGSDSLSRMEITSTRPFKLQTRSSASSSSWSNVDNKIIYSQGMIDAPSTSSDGNKYLRAVINSGTTTFGWKNGLLENVPAGTDYLGYLASHPQGGNDSDQLCVPQTTYVGSNGSVGFFRCINNSHGRVSFQGNLNQPVLVQQGISPTYSAYTTIENKIITSNGLIDAPNGNTDANKYLKWTGSTFTWDTAGGTVPGVASTASGADNPGLLKVQYDASVNIGSSEQTLISPVPIFYGNIDELWLYNNGVHGNKDIIGNQTWHYINIYSIIEAIKHDATLKKAFQTALSD